MAVLLVAVQVLSWQAGAGPARALTASSNSVANACTAPAPGAAQCFAEIYEPSGGQPLTTYSTPSGLSPQSIKSVYGYSASTTAGTGKTIAIVDAFDDPNIVADLAAFSTKYGLLGACSGSLSPPACFQFHEYNETGGTALPSDAGVDASLLSGWELEASLDVEWAHALAPGANIDLIEAASDSFSDLLSAESVAAAKAGYVSNSWGATESSMASAQLDETSYDSYFTASGVSYFAAAGDTGATVTWPSASPDVISVGGTSLSFTNGSFSQESAWSDSGGGCSAYESANSSQSTGSVDCQGKRATPDISLDGDPASGVSVYDSNAVYQNGSTDYGWFKVGGTSAATPMATAIAALTGSHVDATYLYGSTSGIANILVRDITSGSTCASGSCTSGSTGATGATGTSGVPSPPYAASTGYDLATGLGSWYYAPVLSATATSNGISLSWSLPSGMSASKYAVYRGTSSGSETALNGAGSLASSQSTYLDTSATSDQLYYYRVCAMDSNNHCTADSAETVLAPLPSLSSVSPTSGSSNGGTTVALSGTNLAYASSVTVGGAAATISSSSATQVSFTTPGGAVGAADVSVVTPGGTASDAGAFTYTAPPTTSTVPISSGGGGGGGGGSSVDSTTTTSTTATTTTTPAPTTSLPASPSSAAPPSGLGRESFGSPVSSILHAAEATVIAATSGGSTSSISIPPDALPVGTLVSVYPVIDTGSLASSLASSQRYISSFAVSWQTPQGTSPSAVAPITMIIRDPRIVAGDVIYEMTPTGLRALSTATTNGIVAVTFTSDPIFLVATPQSSLTLRSARLTFAKGHVQVRLQCHGRCVGTARLVLHVRVKVVVHKRASWRTRTITLGTARYAITNTRAASLAIGVTRVGKSRLAGVSPRRPMTAVLVLADRGASNESFSVSLR